MQKRIRTLAAVIVLLFFAIVARLFYIQVLHSAYYKEKGEGQYIAERGQSEPRGTIYFKREDGTLISAATMSSGYILAISPRSISDPDLVFESINSIYEIDRDLFYEKMKKTNDPYEEIAHRVPKDAASKLTAAKIKGVFLSRELWRSYPGGSKAAHVLGLVAHVKDYEQGVYGLEKYYEEYLTPPTSLGRVNPFAAAFRHLRSNTGERMDIVTSLEPEVQVALEKTINDVRNTYESEGVGGIVMDPKTGRILAMAYTPAFDPNDISDIETDAAFINPSVSRVYEFGSVVKPLIAAAGFDAGVVTPDTTYMDTGSVKVGIETIHNFDKKGRGLVDIRTILGQSLNTGMVMIEQKLGIAKMRKYLTGYGFRDKTGIDLPSESGSLTSNWDSNREIEFASASFGQGFAVTPVQIIRALSALANEGVPVNPYVVEEIRTPDGKTIEEFEPEYLDRVISKDASRQISDVLVHVVDNTLQNGTLSLPHHSVAAKTGTAQIASPNGGYYEDRYLHSMFAYLPASNPKYIVFLYNVYPKGVEYASASLSKPLFGYLRFLVSYGKILPDR